MKPSNSIKQIFVFGNPLARKDSLPLLILPQLRKLFPHIAFIEADPTETLDEEFKHLWILDTAEGINDVVVIDDLSVLKSSPRVNVHDYDLAIDLKLQKKLNKIKSVNIIAIPVNFSQQKALKGVKNIIISK